MDPFDRAAPLTTRWFTFPAGISALVGIVAVFWYGMWMAGSSIDSRGRLTGIAAAIAVATILSAESHARRYMRTWKRIQAGTLNATVANLQKAAGEAHQIPDKLFVARLATWIVAGLVLPFVLRWLSPQVTWETLVRTAGLGLCVGWLICLVPHFEMHRRCRAFVSRIAARGLSPSQLSVALPPTRLKLRGRLTLFGLIATGVPALLVADLSTGQARMRLEEVAGIQDATARMAAAHSAVLSLRLEVVVMAILMILVIALLSAGAGNVIAEPIRKMAAEAVRVSSGNLGGSDPVVAEAELWTLSTSFVHMETQLASLLGALKKAGVQISSTTEQIVLTSSKHESGAARQASALTQTSSTTEELARSARSIASNASSVAEIANKTLASAELARTNAETFAHAMQRMNQGNQAIAESVSSLNARLGQIGKIIEFINGIADKSEMLALNAELEGVKAGEVGRAFSLVATEMRRMAENVTRSTQEIVELIDQIRDASTEAVRVTEAGVRTTEGSVEIVAAMSKSLSTIVALAGETSEAVKTISSATQQQQSGTDQLAGAMNDILSVTKETETATQAIILANVDLVRLAKDLQDAVERFGAADKKQEPPPPEAAPQSDQARA